MRVRDVMTRRVLVAHEHETLDQVAQTMLWGGTRHLPVLDSGELVGVVSERDVSRNLREKEPITVGEIMTSPAETIEPGADLPEAEGRMHDLDVGCLPVVEGGQLVGMITSTHVLAERVGGHLRQNPVSVSTHKVARDIMTENPETCRQGERILDAGGRMSQMGIRHLPVVDGDGRLVGMLSDRDLRLAVGEGLESETRGKDTTVEQCMTRGAVTARPDTHLKELVAVLADWQIGAIPVVDDDDRPVGIVSYVDILRVLAASATV